jgi:hypothetical protein
MTWYMFQIRLVALSQSNFSFQAPSALEYVFDGVMVPTQQVIYTCLQKIYHKILITFDLLNTTFMTWHNGHLTLIDFTYLSVQQRGQTFLQ